MMVWYRLLRIHILLLRFSKRDSLHRRLVLTGANQPARQPASIPFGSQHMTEQTPSSGTVIKFSLSSKIYYIHSSSNTNLYCTPTPPPTDGDDGMFCAAYALEHIEKLMRRQCPITDWGYGVRCTLVLVSDSCTFENFSDRSIRPPSTLLPSFCPRLLLVVRSLSLCYVGKLLRRSFVCERVEEEAVHFISLRQIGKDGERAKGEQHSRSYIT